MDMAGIRRCLRLVAWMCLLGGSLTMGADTDFETGINEFTSIFPRNETYAPSYLFPFVFAFQNPAVTRSMRTSEILMTLLKWNESTSVWDVNDTASVDLEKMANASGSEPFFAHHVFGDVFNTEAYWTFSWSLGFVPCIEEDMEDVDYMFSRAYGASGRVYFTTKEGAQDPKDSLASGDSQCSELGGNTWNLTEVIYANYREDEVSCAFFSTVTPTPQPCEAQVDSELVESIYASATARVCRWDDSMIECPDEEDTGVSIRGSLDIAWTACLVAFAAGFGLFFQ
ncbi:uncharacterized protein J7T54_007557 [Emericellopsis cladophorae]|uniref:DUF7136 domain-containing protein n=1 Tax=Emericellopsis cladophorae TaxID=2686198 RepID=A0A9Q0BAQ5_9HYPO|nr:uncharacterized protein J7T54_007557 [Emericellopsis cladophorae]KAI6779102.1 hypothetical protein J7T54_007557 [Emericellopsis cladophorae]